LVLSRNATMIEVVDGDTIDVSVGGHRERVRLIGIDTPETNKPNTPVQCYGPEASTFTKSLLPSDVPLHLERDVVARDDYGRMLAYVYLAGDGEFVNLTIIRHGFARPLTIAPNSAHADEFIAAARQAEAGNVGLWGGCSG
jgi:micrococcal nuclease